MKFLLTRLCGVSVALMTILLPLVEGQTAQNESPSVLDKEVSSFSRRGTFEQLLIGLAVHVRPLGIIGLESTSSPPGRQITVSLNAPTTVREILTQLCAADGGHRFTLAHDPRIANVLLIEPDKLTKILDTNVPRFDMSVNAWPINWYSYLTQFSPEAYKVLKAYYLQQSAPVESSGAGSNMETDVRPPHIELHLKNVTILGILNSLGAKELDWALKENAVVSPSGVTYIKFPLGWRARLRPIADLPVDIWIKSVLGPFPPRNTNFPAEDR
jgi:hypothetical protein